MDDERVDLTELAPWPGIAFEATVRRVMRGVQELERPSLERIFIRQGRAVMVLVAMATVIAWIPALLARETSPAPRTAAELVSQWAHTGVVPHDVDVVRVVGSIR